MTGLLLSRQSLNKPDSAIYQHGSVNCCSTCTDTSIVIDVYCLLKCLVRSQKDVARGYGILVEERDIEEGSIYIRSLMLSQAKKLHEGVVNVELTDLNWDKGPV